MRYKKNHLLLSLALALVLTSCVSLGLGGKGGESRIYTLNADKTRAEDLPPAPWQLLVEPVTADASLDTARVALKTSPFSVDYFADVLWADDAPKMLQRLLVESFENAGRPKAVTG
ncbi:MAG: ABC-type transport auxiliary lipoprotein family protein, partial [Pseudomonadota bacterium]|nr:ABC-type transport auxiliary lipoprotein family protein [Pseudomonadota bacterium]